MTYADDADLRARYAKEWAVIDKFNAEVLEAVFQHAAAKEEHSND
jgi:hypothetical protein